jgi:hypothetical protein
MVRPQLETGTRYLIILLSILDKLSGPEKRLDEMISQTRRLARRKDQLNVPIYHCAVRRTQPERIIFASCSPPLASFPEMDER